MRKESDLYKKIVYWSDEDNCFIGMCPELMYGGVHGDDALEVEEVIEIYKEDGTLCQNQKVFLWLKLLKHKIY